MINKLRNEIRKIRARKYIPKDKIAIAVICDGGIGDSICHLNYCYYLHKFSKNIVIDLYNKAKSIDSLYDRNQNYLRAWYDKDDFKDKKKYYYDLVIRIKERFPLVIYENPRRVNNIDGQIGRLANRYTEFYNNFSFYYDFSPSSDGFSANLSLAMGFKRFNQADLYHKLGIKDIEISIPTESDEDVLSKFGLESNNFITINRSVDSGRGQWESTKLWSKAYYEELFRGLKDVFPNVAIVYIGPQVEDYVPFNIVNLGGRTSFNDLKVLLKHSFLHIGPEGGMIHLRHALCRKRSCVLFGPTSQDFYGYPENINLEGPGCIKHCEWLTNSWQERCLHNSGSCCEKLIKLKPDYVISSICKSLNIDSIKECL